MLFTLLLIFCFLGQHLVQCQFRVFRSDEEQREYEQLNDQQRLAVALQYPDAGIVELIGDTQTATVQDGVSLSVDCLPWLQKFTNGSIEWSYIQLDDFGNILGKL